MSITRSAVMKEIEDRQRAALADVEALGSGIMSPKHPEWEDFIDVISGPEGMNFRGIPGSLNFNWDCTSKIDKTICRKWLAFSDPPVDVEKSLRLFEAFGGHCDCEVVFNVAASFRHAARQARPRKNPKRSR